jgi:hypothetical protein
LNKSYLEEQKEELGDPEEEKRAAKRKEEARRRAAMPEAERKKVSLKPFFTVSVSRRPKN